MTAPVVSARNVGKVYSQGEAAMVALDNVSIDIFGGELTLLMGPSGSGKTTLLSILGAILRASSGEVRIDGHPIDGLKDRALSDFRLRHIGFVFQGFNLFPTLSAVQNIELALGLRGITGTQARRQATTLLEQVGLAAKLHTHPAELSGGQKQRVAIARALAGQPTILLADEPTAALDSHSGHMVMQLMQGLAHDAGRAVVIVTHDPRMEPYANRIVRLEDGRIESDHRVLPTSSPAHIAAAPVLSQGDRS